MAEMAVLVAVAGVWSALRLVRCGRCGIPIGVPQAFYRTIALSEECWGCRRRDAGRKDTPLPRRFAASPELERRGVEIRDRLAEMVLRQRSELLESREALEAAGGHFSRKDARPSVFAVN
jgi:hypothetical protein